MNSQAYFILHTEGNRDENNGRTLEVIQRHFDWYTRLRNFCCFTLLVRNCGIQTQTYTPHSYGLRGLSQSFQANICVVIQVVQSPSFRLIDIYSSIYNILTMNY
jgi:hypothetical protein